jgi:diaminohydroxyphosphoribosylaminopyrimidine deaminase/5-amino-6-(5-phosphoribosylamino)uracil reductase
MSDVLDREMMARALRLAERGRYTTHPNPRVGCVIAREGEVIGEGWHRRAGEPHAEVNALQQAGDRANGATAYVTLEPCGHHGRTPPCTEALVAAGVTRVVAAMRDPNPLVAGKGLAHLSAAGITTECGLLASQASKLNAGFARRMTTGRPLVRGKLAMSLDGRTALEDGTSKWITGEAARRDVQKLRAQSSAVLMGVGTVLADNPSMNVRLSADELGIEGDVCQPLRVVLDPYLSMTTDTKMLGLDGDTLIFTQASHMDEAEALIAAGAEVVAVPGTGDAVNLEAVLDELGARGINEVLLETGAVLSGAMLRAGLIDEIIIYVAPHLLGHQARGLFQLPALEDMSQRAPLQFVDVRSVGEDLRITAIPGRP